MQFPSGETLVSYGLSTIWNMRLGDAEARTFGRTGSSRAGRVVGLLGTERRHEVIAAMRNSEKSGDITIALARFELNHRITADPPHGQYRRRQRRVGGDPTTRCSSAKSRRRKPRSAARATTGTSISSWRCSTKPSRATTT